MSAIYKSNFHHVRCIRYRFWKFPLCVRRRHSWRSQYSRQRRFSPWDRPICWLHRQATFYGRTSLGPKSEQFQEHCTLLLAFFGYVPLQPPARGGNQISFRQNHNWKWRNRISSQLFRITFNRDPYISHRLHAQQAQTTYPTWGFWQGKWYCPLRPQLLYRISNLKFLYLNFSKNLIKFHIIIQKIPI